MRDRVVVVGAGLGGLAAAIDLARSGREVTVLERAAQPGGKMRTVDVGGFAVDAGPTVFTMRWVFDGLFEDAGTRLADELEIEAATVLARHAWRAGGTLDLFADVDASATAIGEFAGAREADGFRRFIARARDVYDTLEDSFIAQENPGSSMALVKRLGVRGIPALARTRPDATLWRALGGYFHDRRLRQLFGRYATYVGSSPLSAPATLMLIAHVEQSGVWRVAGGMHATARALARVATRLGATIEFERDVAAIRTRHGRIAAVELGDGTRYEAETVVFNGDASALGAGLLGGEVAKAAPDVPRMQRSLSAITWCLAAHTRGFALSHHNVFFAEDYPEEFRRIFERRDIVDAPTVYLCAQARSPRDVATTAPEVEPLLMLVNAPADGDAEPIAAAAMDEVRGRAERLLAECGLELTAEDQIVTGPPQFHERFPGTGGALYGRANHGPFASFERPGPATDIPGLYLAGGSAHPGAGVPMATLSGRLAAARIVADGEASSGRRSVRASRRS